MDFYSNIRGVANGQGNPTGGRYVDITRNNRTIRLNWSQDFSDWAGKVGVGVDEALRKTDFDVYMGVVDAAFATDGVRSLVINSAWRPSPEDYIAIVGHLPPGVKKRWSPAHVTSRAVDINQINDTPINNGGYTNHNPSNNEPDIVSRFTNNLLNQKGVQQVFQPWRMWQNVNTRYTKNSDIDINGLKWENAILHKHHLHVAFRR